MTESLRSLFNNYDIQGLCEGLTKDIMDDFDEQTFVGQPTLISPAIFNSSKNQVARFDSYPLEVMHLINLTIGSAEQNSKFRIHVVCQLN